MLRNKIEVSGIDLDLLVNPRKLQRHLDLLNKREEANKKALVELLSGKRLMKRERELCKSEERVYELVEKAKQDAEIAKRIREEAEDYKIELEDSLKKDKDYIEQSKKYLEEFAKQLQEKENKLDMEAGQTLSMKMQLSKEIAEAKKIKANYEEQLNQLKSAIENFVG